MGAALSGDPLLSAQEGAVELLLGNEAIVRGALESGVAFACGYPGTPSSEVTDAFARLAPAAGIAFEYAVNEKIALELAFGASLSGARSLVAMKHLGLSYAGDPLATIPYIGVGAGMVIVSAGDPGCRTSPNEQDQRHLADMLHIPTVDPSSPQEALEMTRFAFELSERSGLPVLMRPTARVCHTRAPVRMGRVTPPSVRGFRRDPQRLLPLPVNARRMRVEIDERMRTAAALVEGSPLTRRSGGGRSGILAAGAPAAIVRDVLEEQGLAERVALLQPAAVFPLPERALLDALAELDTLLVVEELSPYLEDRVSALCHRHGVRARVLGKRTGHLPHAFEYDADLLRRALVEALGVGAPREVAPSGAVDEPGPPPRPPILCASCGHRSAMFAARAVFGDDTLYFSDIGCYTLGVAEPLGVGDALLCMGAGFTLAAGASRALGKRTVGLMGDSTFFHSGMPALLDAIKQNADMVAIVLDNGITAMTGFQESPMAQVVDGAVRRSADVAQVARALGAQHVETVDPNDLTATIAAYKRARDRAGLSVIVAQRPCAQLVQRTSPEAAEAPAYTVDQGRCRVCGRGDDHRCAQGLSVPFERAMAAARSEHPTRALAVAPCAERCPLYLCVQGYATHIAAGQYAEAYELIASGLPLPATVCRVCDRPCESACVRGEVDAPVAINDLKRFVVDWADAQPTPPARPACEPAHGRRVAVVGAGPAGLAAAHELALRGYAVTMFDAAERPGGLLHRGIPRYRLPVEALARDVGRVLELGVRFEGGRRLGEDLRLRALVGEFDAVCVAVGAHRALRPRLAESVPLVDALGYLRDPEPPAARRVLVIGGGNAAVDAARTALRAGAEHVTIACLERRDEMPAIPDEVDEALAEGVQLLTRAMVVRLAPEGAEVTDVAQRERGSLAPDNFAPLPGTEQTVAADLVIAAIGQVPERTIVGADDPDVEWTPDGALRVDPVTRQTSEPRVFAAGDVAVTAQGRRTVTGAIAAGLRAAWGIDRALRGAADADRRLPPPIPDERTAARAAGRSPHRPPELARDQRLAGFAEVLGTLDEAQARREAERCLVCGACGNCRSCLDVFGCPAFYLRDGRIEIDPALCVGCGVCAQLCTDRAIGAEA